MPEQSPPTADRRRGLLLAPLSVVVENDTSMLPLIIGGALALAGGTAAVRSSDATLNEGRPCLPEPPPKHASHYTNRNGDSERIESAYRLICAQPTADMRADTHEVVVCHANVIRYVVCRALQLPPEAWLRISLPHASLTHLVIRPNGDVSLRLLGDVGHIPSAMVTY